MIHAFDEIGSALMLDGMCEIILRLEPHRGLLLFSERDPGSEGHAVVIGTGRNLLNFGWRRVA